MIVAMLYKVAAIDAGPGGALLAGVSRLIGASGKVMSTW